MAAVLADLLDNARPVRCCAIASGSADVKLIAGSISWSVPCEPR